MGKILIVDDEGKMRALLGMALDTKGYTIQEAESSEKALKILESYIPDALITDIRMEGVSGIELLKEVKKKYPQIEVIVMTAYADSKTGIEAMRNGALEYIAKPFEMDEMLLLVEKALEKNYLAKEVVTLRQIAKDKYSLDSLTSRSKKMREAISQAKIVAKRDTTVLIRGKSGTGKELFAKGIHGESKRAIFIPINCSAIPENLLESELFGHEKGSFTGAYTRKIGLFEKANNGTLFLDEIGDITQKIQLKLLRVLQEKEFSRVGGVDRIKTNARVITATNRDLEDAVANNEFREDLYYRLNVFPIPIPSLAERIEDIPDLVDFFCIKYNHKAGVDKAVSKLLMEYSWPGNVRELENCIERSIIMAENNTITRSHIPDHIKNKEPLKTPKYFELPDEGISLDEVEKNLLIQALEKAKGNKSQAAKLLGISRRAIYSKISSHGVREE